MPEPHSELRKQVTHIPVEAQYGMLGERDMQTVLEVHGGGGVVPVLLTQVPLMHSWLDIHSELEVHGGGTLGLHIPDLHIIPVPHSVLEVQATQVQEFKLQMGAEGLVQWALVTQA
jgi:hypothetical protein